MTTYHISIHPRIILQISREQHKPLKWLLGGLDEHTDDIDIEIQLLQDIKANKVYTIGECDNKDERGACKGHIRTPETEDDTAVIKEKGE